MPRRLTRLVLFTGLALLTLASVAYATGIRLNLSGSIPPGFYRVVSGPVERGATVLACLPSDVASFARARGYVPSGSCDDGSAPVGKRIAAMAGDTIVVTAVGVFVNGKLLRASAPLQRDSEGRALLALRLASHVVSANEVWLMSSYSAHSFDSRYFGGIPASRVISRIAPILASRW